MISVRQKGDLSKTEKYLKRAFGVNYQNTLEHYAQKGVQALSAATPVRTGTTAASWGYEIKKDPEGFSIYWKNDNINKGVNIALILQYGHGTRTGGYVVGRDYINPAIRPIFDQMAKEIWTELNK